MDLSIVIPAYEESNKIARDIQAAAEFLEKSQLRSEIIIVDDGSKDGTAETAEKAETAPGVELKVVRYENNRGKGYAIRVGMNETQGEYVMFADSGCCVPFDNILPGLELLQNGECDIAHGSRKLNDSRIENPQNLYRSLCSIMFRMAMIYYMKVPLEISDSQCGFKIYRGDVGRYLYGQCITDGFMFDVEIILRAYKESYHIMEFPVQWSCDLDSRLSAVGHGAGIIRELIAIKRALAKESNA